MNIDKNSIQTYFESFFIHPYIRGLNIDLDAEYTADPDFVLDISVTELGASPEVAYYYYITLDTDLKLNPNSVVSHG